MAPRPGKLPSTFIALGAALFAALGCNAIIGADEPKEIAEDASVPSEAATGEACVLNSDCRTPGRVCIFRVCSPPCRADGDCAAQSRCLKTQAGTACVAVGSAGCDGSHTCPGGTSCQSGVCRNSCSSASNCLGQQACVNGACIGTDPDHETPTSADGGRDGADLRDVRAGDADASRDAEKEPGDGSPEAAPGECNAGARQCNEKQPQRCDAGHWVNDGSPCEFACTDGTCSGTCTANATQCASNGVETCGADGKWGAAKPCAYVCTGGKCTGECVPTSKQCSSSTPQVCGDDGKWTSGAACPKVCAAGECVGACVPSSRQCSNLTPQHCDNNGAWVDETPCDYVCNSTGCTGVCKPNTTHCTNGTQETCSAAGAWASPVDCAYVCKGDVCGGSCTPNDTKCLSNGTQKQVCGLDGEWQPATTCMYVCSGKTCGGVCHPDETECPSHTEIRTCAKDGTWLPTSTCPKACVQGACGGQCVPTTTKCAAGSYTDFQTCNDVGEWDPAAPCAYACVNNACGGQCKPGTMKCTTSPQYHVCLNDGQWDTPKSCTYVCAMDMCGGSCTPGNKQCVGNTLQVCDASGAWADQTVCGGGAPLCRSNVCVPSNPYTVGVATKLGDADTESPNILTVVPITITYRTALLRFGMWGRAAGGNVIMALYAESANTPGTPGALVMSSIPMAVASGQMEPPAAQSKQIQPGKYWIGAVFSAQAATWWSMAGGPAARWVNDTYPGTPDPFPTSGVNVFTGYTYNYYIVVQDY